MVYNGDVLGSLLCMCLFLKGTPARITRAISKHPATMRNVFSQQEVAGLLLASRLSLNVSLTNRAVTCYRWQHSHTFNFYSLIFANPFPSTAPLSGKEDDRHGEILKQWLDPCGRCIVNLGGHVLWWTPGQSVLFKAMRALGLFVKSDKCRTCCIRTAEHNSFAHKSSAPRLSGPA